jgi:CDGSH-type Zn-finger protein
MLINLSKRCLNINNVKFMSTNIPRINNGIRPQSPLVKDVIVLEVGQKMAICRCWKSKKFPQCDGAHVEHNKIYGDNVGPIIIAAPKNL